MPVSKLEYLWEHMSDPEREAFRFSLSNSRRKRDEVLLQLWDLLSEETPDNAVLYAAIYPDKPYSDKQIRNLRSELFRRLTDFLAHRLFASSPEMSLFLARALNEKHATRHFPALLDKYLPQDAQAFKGITYADFHNRLYIENFQYRNNTEGRKGMDIEKVMGKSEEVYVAQMLYQGLAYHSASKMYPEMPERPPILMWDAILEKLEQGEWEDSELVQLYYSIYRMVLHPEKMDLFLRVKTALSQSTQHMVISEARQLYSLALNHCVRQLNTGQQEYEREAFHLFREMEERNIFDFLDTNGPWHFKTAVTLAIRMEKYEWARNFMAQHSDSLLSKDRDGLIYYLQGRLTFAEGNFERAESYMHRALSNIADPFMGFDARTYLLRAYYETGNVTGMESLMTSFRLYLRRHKGLRPERLKNYAEFIRFFRRLVTLPPDKPQRILKLCREIEASPYQAGRDWLLAKLGHLLPQEKQA